jgi:hypothetical protein
MALDPFALHDDDLLELYACDELSPLRRARVARRLRREPVLRERLAVIAALVELAMR